MILVRTQSEMRKMLLDMGGKEFLAIKWQKSWQSCVLVISERQNLRDRLEYLANGISKYSVEGVVWFLLNAYSKVIYRKYLM